MNASLGSFILTIWNVNSPSPKRFCSAYSCFILTIWNVNSPPRYSFLLFYLWFYINYMECK